MWIELCSNRFFNIKQAEMIYPVQNRNQKYDIIIMTRYRNTNGSPNLMTWEKDFETEGEALDYIRHILIMDEKIN